MVRGCVRQQQNKDLIWVALLSPHARDGAGHKARLYTRCAWAKPSSQNQAADWYVCVFVRACVHVCVSAHVSVCVCFCDCVCAGASPACPSLRHPLPCLTLPHTRHWHTGKHKEAHGNRRQQQGNQHTPYAALQQPLHQAHASGERHVASACCVCMDRHDVTCILGSSLLPLVPCGTCVYA